MNYDEVARTNRFKVKDDDVFRDEVSRIDSIGALRADGHWLLLMVDGVPTEYWPNDDDDFEGDAEFSLPDFLAGHLAEGEVAVVMISGHQGMRYMTGIAFAVNCRNEQRWISTNTIYTLARELRDEGDDRNIPFAEY